MATDKRFYADCRLFKSEKDCSLYIAGTEDEVMRTAMRHAVEEHGEHDTPEFRKQLRDFLQEEKPVQARPQQPAQRH